MITFFDLNRFHFLQLCQQILKSTIKIVMTDLQAKRSTILQQSDIVSTKQRFGLFNQPMPTAVGDNGAYKQKLHPRNQQGKPVTQQRNFVTSPTKSGINKSSFFGDANYLATSDKKDFFLEEGKRLIKQDYQKFNTGRKEASFFPNMNRKSVTNSAYPYVEQKNPELNPKRFRAQDGKVISNPPNFYTNPQSRVVDTMFKRQKHMDDPYDRKHTIELTEMKKNKLKQHQAAYRPNSFCPQLLNKHQKVYEEDVELKPREQKQTKFNIYPHDNGWRRSSPTKSGLNGFINKFPQYKQDPPKETTRKPVDQNKKQPFKKMSISHMVPSPSISLNRSNLNRSLCMTRR